LGIKLLVPAIASILILGSIGIVQQSYAGNSDIPPDDWVRGDDCAATYEFLPPFDTSKDTSGFPGQLLPPGDNCSAGSINPDEEVNQAYCETLVVGEANSQVVEGSEKTCHFHVPNYDDPFNTKLLRVNVFWTGSSPSIFNVKPLPNTLDDCIRGNLVNVGPGHFYEDWTCHPNPDNERIWIPMDPKTDITRVVVDSISFDRNAVGGDIIPLDTTMILVAGTQSTAAWMIPVIVSGIGFAIVIARKF